MMEKYLIKYSEIGVKGKNKHIFEDRLVANIRKALKKTEGSFDVYKTYGRIYVDAEGADDTETVQALRRVFGIADICPVVQIEKGGFSSLKEAAVQYIADNYPDENSTFKVFTKRAHKDYPMTSQEINAALGEAILDAYPDMSVDVHDPVIRLYIEVREKINIYSKSIPGPGGMPVGSSGNATLLLSGGIDSPVAGYMMARRGVKINAVYFHAPPYTSERARQKVIDLARIIMPYTGPMDLYVVNFTDIQLYIYEQCPHDELTIIMRRYMMRIAEHFALESDGLGLVTGESVGQVASQTMQSMLCTNDACTLPVYRPLCAFDKMDIVKTAQDIGTYETSILPYEDCCTIFVAKHPVTKPRLERIKKSEMNLEEKIEELYETAVDTAEIVHIR